jgi:DNA-binding response OmpR family regulator
MAKKLILIIDDDIQIGNLEQEILEREGYICKRAYSGTEAILVLEKERPDLILLDLMLPGISGENVLKKIRGIPVIVVSAKVGIDDKVSMLLGGATDYITKPFNTRELLARVEVQLRKNQTSLSDVYRFGDILLDTVAHMVSVCGKIVNLTKTEYAILKLLVQNPNQVIAKATILERISEDTLDCTENLQSSEKIFRKSDRKRIAKLLGGSKSIFHKISKSSCK